MKIEETVIPNIVEENLDNSKLILANNIIENVYPLFDEVYSGRIEEIDNIKKDLDLKKQQVRVQKEKLQELMDNYKKKKKIAKLLDRLDKMVSAGLIYDGAIKHETIVLLKIANNLSDDKLDYHLRSTLKTLSKRFSR
jgi:ATP-dependent Lon protease